MLTYLFIILVVILLTDTKYVTSYNTPLCYVAMVTNLYNHSTHMQADVRWNIRCILSCIIFLSPHLGTAPSSPHLGTAPPSPLLLHHHCF